jgi:hypothetical protein
MRRRVEADLREQNLQGQSGVIEPGGLVESASLDQDGIGPLEKGVKP